MTTIPQATVPARLDKSGTRILCGAANGRCSGHIADVFGKFRFVHFVPGWRRAPDGVWQLTNHARRRYQRGLPLKNRRPYRKPLRPEPSRAPHDQAGGGAPALPAVAVCPRCGRRNYLDPERLGLFPNSP